MAVEFIWEIRRCLFDQNTGGIVAVFWSITAKTPDEELKRDCVTQFNPDASLPTFTQYDDVTEQQVLQWVWNTVKKDKVEAYTAQKLRVNTPSVSYSEGLPW
jgi:hypothetical protein